MTPDTTNAPEAGLDAEKTIDREAAPLPKPIEDEAPLVNEHGLTIGAEASFADVMRMQRAIWSQGQAEPVEAPAEKPSAKRAAKASKAAWEGLIVIVEDGSGVPDADSLASLEFADAYLEARGDAVWAGLADEAKEAALVRATDHVEGVYASRWLGRRVDALQSLSWPRSGVYIVDAGYTVGVSIVPVAVQRAVVELAARIGAGTDIAPDLSTREVVREKVDVIEIEYKASGPGSRTQPGFPAVDRLLAPYLLPAASAGTIKLYRV